MNMVVVVQLLSHVSLFCDSMDCSLHPSPSPGVCSNSCSLSWWCHPTISSSVIPLSSSLQSFPASGSFPVSELFASGGQSIEGLASASVLPMSTQGWFPSGLTVGSPCSPRGSKESSPAPQFKGINSLVLSLSYCPALTFIHEYRMFQHLFSLP